jgi:hypothetical protein
MVVSYPAPTRVFEARTPIYENRASVSHAPIIIATAPWAHLVEHWSVGIYRADIIF